jgi:ACS family hexuronate transporter-like MFS transporter
MLSGAAGSVGSLSAWRALLGAAEAFNWPSALKMTQRLVPAGMRAFANGLFNSGMAAGAVAAPLIITLLTLRFGFRAAFVVTGALGFAWLAGWLLITHRDGDALSGMPSSVHASLTILWSIPRKSAFWNLGVSAVAINCVLFFLADWIPLYLKTERGFSYRTGNLLTMITYAGLDAGNLVCGLLVRFLVQTGKSLATARIVALAANSVLMSAAVLTGIVSNRYGALVCIAMTAFGATGFQVIYLTLVQDLDPKNVGAAAGLLGGLGNLAYGLVSPQIGHLADLHQTALIFAAVGVLPWLAFLAIASVIRSAAVR